MARERKFSTKELFLATKENLLRHGYEGFTFSILAKDLNVSRGTLYKYYENKEELILEYMLYELQEFLQELQEIHTIEGFEPKLDFLLHIMFKNEEIQQLIEIGQQVPRNINQKVLDHKKKLERLHLEMYHNLTGFIELGKHERKIKPHLPDSLILGFIFQTIAIPNHFGVDHQQWVQSIKEMICYGMLDVDTSVTLEDNES